MVGILLLTHAPLGQAFLGAAAHVFRAPPERLEALDVRPHLEPADVERLAHAAIARLDGGAGVLVLTDIMGGTPSNCCSGIALAGQVEVVAGLSLPMLLRALTYRTDTLEVAAEMAVAGGQAGAVRVDRRIRLAIN